MAGQRLRAAAAAHPAGIGVTTSAEASHGLHHGLQRLQRQQPALTASSHPAVVFRLVVSRRSADARCPTPPRARGVYGAARVAVIGQIRRNLTCFFKFRRVGRFLGPLLGDATPLMVITGCGSNCYARQASEGGRYGPLE